MIPAGKSLGALLLAACLGLTPGCVALDYYAQAVSGHLSIMTSCRPVKELLADPDLDPPTRAHLELSQALTAFAAIRLGLEPGTAISATPAWIVPMWPGTCLPLPAFP